MDCHLHADQRNEMINEIELAFVTNNVDHQMRQIDTAAILFPSLELPAEMRSAIDNSVELFISHLIDQI